MTKHLPRLPKKWFDSIKFIYELEKERRTSLRPYFLHELIGTAEMFFDCGYCSLEYVSYMCSSRRNELYPEMYIAEQMWYNFKWCHL